LPFKYIFLAGFFLGIISVFAISFGENFIYRLNQFNTLSIQSPIALIIAIIVFFTYVYILLKIDCFDIEKYTVNDSLLIYVVAIVLSPAIFFLINYFTKDVMVSWKGIFSVLFWQIPANLIMISMLNSMILKWKR
jgi:hypothetical protein